MKKYNPTLFFAGFFMNIIKNYYIFFPGIILCIAGIWVKVCLFIGLFLLLLDIIFSLFEQIRIKHAVEHNDDLNFKPWAEAMMAEDWKKSIQNLVNDAVENNRKDNNE